MVVGMWATGSTARRVPGIEDAGPLTSWGLPLARIAVDIASVATVGALLLAGVLLPGGRALGRSRTTCLTWAAVAAGLWSLASVALMVLTLSDLFARPVAEVLDPATVADFALTSAQGRAYAVTAAAGLVLATLCAGVTTVPWTRAALVLAVGAVLPPAFTGHSAASADHDAAVTSLALHVAGVAVWVGGAHMMMRSYITGAVRIENTDPADPTPYVYLSTRTPQALANAVDADRTR
ncbi:DUF3093 family protein [Streptomyces sp. NPDC015130]|uniref:DUF3093 family protein n=1 Tax=Streptomyces sp. NPDC015130 TaxID=3364940 RepID=UPI0037004343